MEHEAYPLGYRPRTTRSRIVDGCIAALAMTIATYILLMVAAVLLPESTEPWWFDVITAPAKRFVE